MKGLHEMSLDELWQLFPIELQTHNPDWSIWAREEIELLSGLLHPFKPVVSHIGSTAIAGIVAKPIVDILVEIPEPGDWDEVKNLMNRSGYLCMNSSANRMSFNKGYTPQGYAERVFHIHVRHSGDNDEILFRDYLNAHPAEARRYEAIKQSLLPRFRNDRDGYTEAKTDFVRMIMERASFA